MVSVFDVAVHILDKFQAPLSSMKLQRLCYYAQAWSLVWEEKALFENSFEAWANGPICRDLYNEHKGKFTLLKGQLQGDASKLSQEEKQTIDDVLKVYGKKSATELSGLTQNEGPWKEARVGLSEWERGEAVITQEAIARYYTQEYEMIESETN
jgi:uncharacterized phage-associated protein